MQRPHRCFLQALLILLVLGFGATRASAQAGEIIIEVGKWLGGQIVSYATGKTFDRLLGIDYEKQLKQVEANLGAQLRKGAGDAQRLRVELDATRSQLSMLQTLLYSKPTSNQLEKFRQQLTSDLAKVAKIQQEHTQRIVNLERTTQNHEARLKRLEERANGEVSGEVEQPPPANEPTNASISEQFGTEPVVTDSPRLEVKPQPRAIHVEVHADVHINPKLVWVNTGLDVLRGRVVSVEAEGRVRTHPTFERAISGPEGQSRNVCNTQCTLPRGNFGQLIGKIGISGQIFIVGTVYRGIADGDGMLYLGVNDCCDWSDNEGGFQAKISVENRSRD